MTCQSDSSRWGRGGRQEDHDQTVRWCAVRAIYEISLQGAVRCFAVHCLCVGVQCSIVISRLVHWQTQCNKTATHSWKLFDSDSDCDCTWHHWFDLYNLWTLFFGRTVLRSWTLCPAIAAAADRMYRPMVPPKLMKIRIRILISVADPDPRQIQKLQRKRRQRQIRRTWNIAWLQWDARLNFLTWSVFMSLSAAVLSRESKDKR